ncbi:ClbS/DfsB family four-helix bundle protein [Corynebacterium sp. H127]|uniref:ClbS/DfsB family four-helix bundle protein n=1 Tax=Corynebacterium sp. H127 TaxID=3133418 RepID=UPI0030AD74C3
MARATTKADLLVSAQGSLHKLNELVESLTETELSTPFDFASDPAKKEAHWSRDKRLRDIYIHLYEWHKLLLTWVSSNLSGTAAPFLPEPYNWRTYGKMNIEFWEKHQATDTEKARNMFLETHSQVIKLAEEFTNDELFSKGAFSWVGGSTLGSYFVSATASHYDWAMKKLRAHRKHCK